MNTIDFKEDDIVFCTVKRIEGATVFVDIEGKAEGQIMFSEVAPGRIRNIREFVTEGKKIVCKVLRMQDTRIELSLRRVTAKEREEVLARHKRERTLVAILEPILKEKLAKTLAAIEKEYALADFLETARETPAVLDKFMTKTEVENMKKILAEKPEKTKEVKKIILCRSLAPSGLYDIQKALATDKAEVTYLGSSRFLVRAQDKDFKRANTRLLAVLKEIEDRARSLKVQIEIK